MIKYGVGYITLDGEDGTTIKVTVEQKAEGVTAPYKPYPIKDIAKLVEALR